MLNGNHRSILYTTLMHIDQACEDIVRLTQDQQPPLSRYIEDVPIAHRRIIADHIAQLRGRIRDALESLAIPVASPSIFTSNAIRALLVGADVALLEVAPSRLSGYGPIDGESADRVAVVLGDLGRAIARTISLVSQADRADLTHRINELPIGPVPREQLEQVRQIVSHHGRVEYRGRLESLIEHCERGDLEVAVFGRISSGKSSLLNWLLGENVLPVGVTPITAVPTRIVRGDAAQVLVSFADGVDATFGHEALPQFVSEQENPDNARGVTNLVVVVPTPRLPQHVQLVDTPGVGALARGGRASLAYLPCCDVGLVLIEATAPPHADDLDLLRRLQQSGITSMVLLSKADLLQGSEREELVDYVRRSIYTAVGASIPVYPVSVRDPGAALTEAWLNNHLTPWLDGANAAACAALRRKFAALCTDLATDLQVGATTGGRPEIAAANARRLEDHALKAEGILQGALRYFKVLQERLADLAADAVTVATREHCARVRGGSSEPPEATYAEIVTLGVDDIIGRTTDQLLDSRDRLRQALRDVAACAPGSAMRPQDIAVDFITLPTWTWSPGQSRSAHFPTMLAFAEPLARPLLTLGLRRCFEEARTATRTFALELEAWQRRTLDLLSKQFSEQVDPLRSRAQFASRGAQDSVESAPDDARALRILASQVQDPAEDDPSDQLSGPNNKEPAATSPTQAGSRSGPTPIAAGRWTQGIVR